MIYYNSAEDANLRLRGTIVLYRNKPVRVFEVLANSSSEVVLKINDCLSGKNLHIILTDPDLDIRSISSMLGYMNYNCAMPGITGLHKEAVYVQRSPSRISQQGLCQRNTRIPVVIPFDMSKFRHTPALETVSVQPYFYDMITGNYPSFNQALDSLSDTQVKSVAFSRNFAIIRTGEVMYRNIYIADIDGTSIKLSKKFKYLAETVESETNNQLMVS